MYRVVCKNETKSLYEYNRCHMTDSPRDVAEMRAVADKCHGTVLTAGLGLGIFLEQCEAMGCDVTVVERSQEVIGLYGRNDIICADIFDYLKTAPRFDCVFIDIHNASKADIKRVNPQLRELAEKISDNVFIYGDL